MLKKKSNLKLGEKAAQRVVMLDWTEQLESHHSGDGRWLERGRGRLRACGGDLESVRLRGCHNSPVSLVRLSTCLLISLELICIVYFFRIQSFFLHELL